MANSKVRNPLFDHNPDEIKTEDKIPRAASVSMSEVATTEETRWVSTEKSKVDDVVLRDSDVKVPSTEVNIPRSGEISCPRITRHKATMMANLRVSRTSRPVSAIVPDREDDWVRMTKRTRS